MDYKKGWIKVDKKYVIKHNLPFGFIHPIKKTVLERFFKGERNLNVLAWAIFFKDIVYILFTLHRNK